MPYLEVNGFSMYFETYGKEEPGKIPIVLIHGSTGTGRSNWSAVAPLLARQYYIIVPDCRGHGQSTNPTHSYSFKQMADDIASMVPALGYERVHLIGHSNGGNVVLVALLEHPEVIQTCIPQAANAYVSPDLVEKEPPLFDPDRVRRDAPDWMNEMIELHGPTHGAEYWKDLLQWTVQEIITEPNYTPEDLAKVQRPTLVIQGENDRVNAPARHAQFIAAHIPEAELWIPTATGHNVHDERLFEWIERVTGFLERRGDDANDALYRLGRRSYGDERETVFRVRAAPQPEGVSLAGKVLLEEQRQAARDSLPGTIVEDKVEVLLNQDTSWALVKRVVTDLNGPTPSGGCLTQALLGEAVRILEEDGDWAFVRLEGDGYLGWIKKIALHLCSQQAAKAYQEALNYLVRAEVSTAYYPSTEQFENQTERVEAGKLPFGVAVQGEDQENGEVEVCLPDGRRWRVDSSDLLPLSQRPSPDAEGIAGALAMIRRFTGTPYLWGGRSAFGFDCSGFAQTFLNILGVSIRRDADQQFRDGAAVEGRPQPGDLLFFGEPKDEIGENRFGTQAGSYISHVAVSLGNDEMIHANGTHGCVGYNSLDPKSPIYRSWLKENLVGVRRYWK